MNLFAIKAITRAPIDEIIAGVASYVALLILGLALVMFFPAIALWLPGTMQYKQGNHFDARKCNRIVNCQAPIER